MKKVIAMLLSLTMVFGMAACGGTDTQEEGGTAAEEAAAESSDGFAVYEATEEGLKETKQEKAAVKAKAPAYVSKYAPDRFEVASLQYLRELKALTDEGVLTEQEFAEEKKRFFNR